MTLSEAMTQFGPSWLSIWLPILMLGAFALPLALLIWKSTRVTALICVAASLLGGIGVNYLYVNMGYVKLLGLPHLVVWTPLVIFLWFKINNPAIEKAARVVMSVVLATIVISLAFDYVDVARYVMGDRTPPA